MPLNENQRQLEEFNALIRRWLEQAEARLPHLDDLISRACATGLFNDVVLLGDTLIERPYAAETGPHDSGAVLQPAILLPGGIGAAVWDTEEYIALATSQEGLESEARQRFIPLDSLCDGEKALLMLQLPPLMARAARLVRPLTPPGA